MSKPEMKCLNVFPTLAVLDVTTTIEWYVKKLGFTHRFSYGDPITHGAVELGPACVHFYSGVPLLNDNWLYFHLEEVDLVFEWMNANGVKVIKEPQDYPWGMREFNIVDSNGYNLRFGANSGNHHHH